ncbi:response regulator [uncultured Ferrovibrio sp.]|jgi:two-component system chemotaxis response regulator CheY|uniref:response regulator n=1 Tax=uncultured Ferrovibrio sp. TaxID=1576913 RepID=UPI002607AA66|nr:response regulator [uncultured Ferrovibrio sp.]
MSNAPMADLERIDFSKISFLVVEPNRLMGQMVRDVLLMLDAQYIDRARDYQSAIQLLKVGRIDVMITEWALSHEVTGKNGMDIVHWVRNDPASPNPFMPIVMMTANSEEEYVCRARDAGVSEFVAKPYTVQGFYTRLAAAIARPRRFVRVEDYFGPDRRRRSSDTYDGPERRIPAEPN